MVCVEYETNIHFRRSTLSPAFTGHKMRLMFELIDECSEEVTDYFLKKNSSEEGTKTVDMKDLFSRFTNDVVATVSVKLI